MNRKKKIFFIALVSAVVFVTQVTGFDFNLQGSPVLNNSVTIVCGANMSCNQSGTNLTLNSNGLVQGPQGPQGVPGVNGSDGSTGPQGPPGLNGTNGSDAVFTNADNVSQGNLSDNHIGFSWNLSDCTTAILSNGTGKIFCNVNLSSVNTVNTFTKQQVISTDGTFYPLVLDSTGSFDIGFLFKKSGSVKWYFLQKGAANDQWAIFNSSGNQVFVLDQSGELGLSTIPAISASSDAVCSVASTIYGGIAAFKRNPGLQTCTFSDMRKKDNISVINISPSIKNKFMNIEVIKYQDKDDPLHTWRYGINSTKLGRDFPMLVSFDADGVATGVRYEILSALDALILQDQANTILNM